MIIQKAIKKIQFGAAGAINWFSIVYFIFYDEELEKS